jgi:recombinase
MEQANRKPQLETRAAVRTATGKIVWLQGRLPEPYWLNRTRFRKGTWHYTKRDDRVAAIIWIFERCKAGLDDDKISKTMPSRFSPPRSKSEWKTHAVANLLKDRRVMGEFRQPDGIVIKDFFPPVISEGLFNDAKYARDRRRGKGRGRKGKYYSNLFGLPKCAHCECRMKYEGKGPSAHYVCKNGECPCAKAQWRYEDFENSFDSYFELHRKVQPEKSNEIEAIESEIRMLEDEKVTKQQEIKKAKQRLTEIRRDLFEKKRSKNSVLKYEKKEAKLHYLISQKREADDGNARALFNLRAPIAQHLKEIVGEIQVDSAGILPDMEGHKVGKRFFTVFFQNGNGATVVPNKEDPRLIDSWHRWEGKEEGPI